MAVEGFNKSELGIILDKNPGEIMALLEDASKSIVNQVATDVMIIEDEPIIAMDLEALLVSLGHRVTGVARTEKEALHLASSKRPGLVLADIQLADGSSGLDAVNRILVDVNVPVVFITAFPERLLTGEKPEPAFLITKPFMPDMVKAVVSQALFFDDKAGVAA
jgi:CheY-like chemotaxis protein